MKQDEMIERLSRVASSYDPRGKLYLGGDLREQQKALEQAIDQLRWRSVEDAERPDCTVLITNGNDMDMAWVTDDDTWIGSEGNPTARNITHWMPLPNPPE